MTQVDPNSPAAKRMRALYVTAVHKFEMQKGQPSSFGDNEIARYDGGTDTWGRRYSSVWPKLVEFMERHNLMPEVVFEAMVSLAVGAGAHRVMTPTQLMTDKSLAMYERKKLHLIEELAIECRCSQVILDDQTFHYERVCGWPTERARRYALTVQATGLRPLFRYVAALKYGYTDIAAKFRTLALDEYNWNVALLEGWRDIIPESVVAEAAAFRAQRQQ